MDSYYLDPIGFIAGKSGKESCAVKNILELLNDGATIPFIARYQIGRAHV